MADNREGGRPPRVTVVDRDVPEAGWQRLDLAPLKGLPADGPLALAVPVAFPVRREVPLLPAPSLAQIPPEALIAIARRSPPGAFAKRGPAASANDNGRGPRLAWRDVFFLTILFATVFGAFWGGRLHAYQRVIVVPQPSIAGGVIT